MSKLRKIKLGKFLGWPIAILALAAFAWPFFWMASTAVVIASYSAGLTNHLGATRGYFYSNKMTDFATFPTDRIRLSYGYGPRKFWVSEGTEIYLKYSATNYGEERVTFFISDYNGIYTSKERARVSVEDQGSGTLYLTAQKSGFYHITIIPKRLVSATENVNYSYSMSWGTTQPQRMASR